MRKGGPIKEQGNDCRALTTRPFLPLRPLQRVNYNRIQRVSEKETVLDSALGKEGEDRKVRTSESSLTEWGLKKKWGSARHEKEGAKTGHKTESLRGGSGLYQDNLKTSPAPSSTITKL